MAKFIIATVSKAHDWLNGSTYANKLLHFLPEHNPTVTSSAQKVILIPGKSLSEWCRAYSQGRPEITWYLDGVPLHDGNGYSITSTQLNQGTQSTLKSDTMSVEKTGEYKCVACNIGNCSSQAISVYIDGEYGCVIPQG